MIAEIESLAARFDWVSSAAPEISEMENTFRTKSRFGDGASQRCFHCHMVTRAEVFSLHGLKRQIPDQTFWHFP